MGKKPSPDTFRFMGWCRKRREPFFSFSKTFSQISEEGDAAQYTFPTLSDDLIIMPLNLLQKEGSKRRVISRLIFWYTFGTNLLIAGSLFHSSIKKN
jgi:hypothetical protein